MTNLLQPDGMAGCFRCAYAWRPRSPNPERCPRCKSKLWDTPRLRAVRYGRGQGVREILAPHRDAVARLLHENKARNLRVFGSVARREATRSSDIDLLVDFDADASILDQIQLKQELESLLHRKVDVVDSRGLHWLVRPQVLFEAVPA